MFIFPNNGKGKANSTLQRIEDINLKKKKAKIYKT